MLKLCRRRGSTLFQLKAESTLSAVSIICNVYRGGVFQTSVLYILFVFTNRGGGKREEGRGERGEGRGERGEGRGERGEGRGERGEGRGERGEGRGERGEGRGERGEGRGERGEGRGERGDKRSMADNDTCVCVVGKK